MTRGSIAELLREQSRSLDRAVGHLLDGLDAGRPTDTMVIDAVREVGELFHLLKDIERSN